MRLDNDTLPINMIVKKINDAATSNQPLSLSVEEVKVLAADIGDQYFVPVLTNEQIVQMCKEGKLGQPIFPQKEDS